jgi:hypothetical protein
MVALASASAQTPTSAQQQAIKSNCASDYRAHCSSVPTGGMDALVCLEQNVASLSPACKSAVEAVEGPSDTSAASTAAAPAPAAPAAAPTTDAAAPAAADTAASPPADTAAPAATEAAPAATAAAPPPAMAPMPPLTLRQEMRIAGGACRTDFRVLCPNLPVGRGNVIFCLRVHAPRLAPACRNALTAVGVPLQ